MPKLELGGFVKIKRDVQEGDIIKFIDEGEYVQSKFKATDPVTKETLLDDAGQPVFKSQFNIAVEIPDGTKKTLTMNKVSQRNLAEVYGTDTAKWVGKQAKVFLGMSANGKDMIILKPEVQA